MPRTARRHRPVTRILATLALVLAGTVTVAVSPHAAVAHADTSAQGGDYVPVAPAKVLLDTRTGVGAPAGKRGASTTTSFPALGVSGLPSAGVSALLVRVITIDPTATTYLTAFPDGTTRPGVASVNADTGEKVSNTAIVRPGANGKIAVYNRAGSVDIFVEVRGYFTTSTGSTWGGLVPVSQKRVIDTRSGTPFAAHESRTFSLATNGIPAGATAVFAVLTVTPPPAADGYFNALPTGATTASFGVIHYKKLQNTATSEAIPLAADGRVTFTNWGTGAAHLTVDTMAYFSKTPTAGSGLRPVTGRLFGAEIPANSTVDVAVGGTFGLPTRGIAAAALSLQAGGPAAGYLRVWGTDTPEPTTVTQVQHPAGGIHRAGAVVALGTDGKVRVRNVSSGATMVFVDLEGWFAEPLPVVSPVQHSPVSVLQASPTGGQSAGTVEYAYTDNIGRVVVGHQSDLNGFCCVQFTTISGNEAFSGQPALTPRADGTVQLAAQYSDGDIWTTSQTAPGAPTWNPWSDFGGSMAAAPAAGVLADGTTALFAIDTDGKLWVYVQAGTVPGWRNLGDADLTGSPTVVLVRDGLQVFARNNSGAVVTMVYRTDGSVSPWTDLGGTGTGAVAAMTYPGYRVRVVARDAGGMVVTKLQATDGTFPAAWDTIGTFPVAGAPAVMLDPRLGRTFVVARGSDNTVYASWETTQGAGTFGDWSEASTSGLPAASDPTTALVNTGTSQMAIYVYRTINDTIAVFERRDPTTG